MGNSGLRLILQKLRKTPLHPQWIAYLREHKGLTQSCGALAGPVLDVGCADGKPRNYLPNHAEYVGLDYFATATEWHGTRPDVFGDAQQLPFMTAAIDHVLLLDVLEHVPEPDRCLAEVYQILKPRGTLTLQVPFMYPIHDEPLDFHRWTRSGLQRAARRAGFSVSTEIAVGHPLETAALGANIAMSKTVLNWISSRNPLMLLGAVLPLMIVLVNCAAWLAARVSRSEDMMPYAYRMVWAKS